MTIRSEADVAAALAALRDIDPRLHPVIEAAGSVPLRRSAGGLPGLLGIVTAQQVSRASAAAIFARFSAALDLADADAILAADDALYRAVGLSRPKQRTIHALAEAVRDGRLDFSRIEAAPADDAIAELVAVHGIGLWTAECYLLFCAGHPDVFPAGDLALQVAVAHTLGFEARPAPKRLADLAEAWAPHRSVAARLFWAYYAAVTRRDAAPVTRPIAADASDLSTASSPPLRPGPKRRLAKSL
ncbi:DNA-3-methyladenine glycosylase [Jiella sp. M17.18]|uniref:DNA-3-methyladenine glycosylase family protein n=1 Tax=Jiella sp. M17.18 TaxID=3234247 RepID=UPI0034DEFABB